MATNRENEIRLEALEEMLKRLKETDNIENCAPLAHAIAALLNATV